MQRKNKREREKERYNTIDDRNQAVSRTNARVNGHGRDDVVSRRN